MAYQQTNRIGTIECELGKDVLLLYRLQGREAIDELFEFHLEMGSENRKIDFTKLVGTSLTLRIRMESGKERVIHGLVSEVHQTGDSRRLGLYQATLVPWFWLLTQRKNCRIFQEKSVPEIVKAVFSDARMLDFTDQTKESYPKREYCVQYRESDFNFVSRLLEEAGIGYYFQHEAKCHRLILFDHNESTLENPQQTAMYIGSRDIERPGNVWTWSEARAIRTGAFALKDYNFEQPSTDLGVTTTTPDAIGKNSALEAYDYPGRYQAIDEGTTLVRTQMQSSDVASYTIQGDSDCALFAPGTHFKLAGHPRADFNRDYLLTSVDHDLDQTLTPGEARENPYSNVVSCIPKSLAYSPDRSAIKPTIHGVQTAVVVGPAGKEIHVDRFGRVKLKFHWDRDDKRDDTSSCWVRVSQPWAGKSWGGMAIPRVGQEVIVDFLEGDPDRPIITGRVYNAEQMPPYPLPDAANVTGIKSNSTPGGGGFNEIKLDDTKGQELLGMHAQHDMSTEVLNDQTLTVHKNRTEHVMQVYEVTGDKKICIISGGSTITLDPQHIELSSGGSTITLNAMGISINGVLVRIN